MKRLSLIFIIFVCALTTMAQDYLGFQLGYARSISRLNSPENKTVFTSTPYDGFKLGLLYDATIIKGFGVTLGLNYTFGIINKIEAKEYIGILHTDFKEQNLSFVVPEKVTKLIGVSQTVCDSFKEQKGLECELCYNPIEIEKPKKVLNLISATRLTKEKGKDNIIKFARKLDEAGIPYLWTIFTDDTKVINNPNIIYMKPRLDIIDYIANADFLCQFSKAGEGFGYTIAESLSVGTPVIVTPNKAFLEIGVKDGENGFVVDYDLNDVDVKKIYESDLKNKFKYKVPADNWKNILAKGESTYKKDLKTIVKVMALKDYWDIELQKFITKGTIFETNKIRAENLVNENVVKIIDE